MKTYDIRVKGDLVGAKTVQASNLRAALAKIFPVTYGGHRSTSADIKRGEQIEIIVLRK